MSIWKSFWRLSRSERVIAMETVAAIIATRAGLRVAGYWRWKRILSRLSRPDSTRLDALIPETPGRSLSDASRFARVSIGAARRLFFRANCLEQLMALWWLLRRRGFSAEICLGGRKDGERFEAHAWVELEGVVVSDMHSEQAGFMAFAEARALDAGRLR